MNFIRRMKLRWHLYHAPRKLPGKDVLQVHLVADYLIAERDRINDPEGRSVAYRQEALKVIDLCEKLWGTSHSITRNRVHKMVQRKLYLRQRAG